MSIQDSEALKQQFQLIQEQQQKKLLARKQKSTNNSTKAKSATKDNWGVEDDLDLKHDIRVPDEEELHIHSKLQEFKQANRVLKDENGRLYKLLGERDEEMRIIRKQRDNERKALAGTGVASDTAAGKIVELSKKNRELTAELQSEKNKVRQLVKRGQDLEGQVQTKPVPVHTTNDNGIDEETKELHDKLKNANFKMAEYRNQCEALKKDLKIAHKVLSKELGEHVNMASILNDPSAWRGRQQQISVLHNKVTELKGQLHEAARCGSTTSSNFLRMSSLGTPSSLHDDKHKSMLKRIEKDRKDNLEKTKSELENLNVEHSKLQQKLDASKARIKVLSNELKSVKAQIKTLLEKGAHDDELIAALMREQRHLKESSKRTTPQPHQPQVIVTQDTTLVNHLKQLCHDQEGRIKELDQQLDKTKQKLEEEVTEKENTANHPRPQTADVGCSTEDLPTKLPHSSSEPNINRLILEDNTKPRSPGKPNVAIGSTTRRNGPQSPASRFNNRVGYPLPPTPPSAGRHSRGRRSSASNSEEVHVLRCQVQEVKSLSQASEVERDRLLELVSVLQKRIDEEKSKSLHVTTKLQEQRVMNAHIEKQLGRVQTSQTFKSSHSSKSKARGSSSRLGQDSERSNEELEEIKVWLEIQKDENEALKEALNSTLKAKEEDLKFYQEMMEQTKKIFLQGLRQFRQNSAPS